jgi:NADH-quinone oxidoreductase subunit H
MLAGSFNLSQIVQSQAGLYFGLIPRWNIIMLLPGAIIFLVAMMAELNRLPFDLVECEQELVAGIHLEYSSMKFASFYIAEYVNMITASALFTALFLGGWLYPGYYNLKADNPVLATLIGFAAFAFKVFLMVWLIIQIRWTLPRFRFDQLMNLCWKRLLPMTLIWLFLVATGILILNPPVSIFAAS